MFKKALNRIRCEAWKIALKIFLNEIRILVVKASQEQRARDVKHLKAIIDRLPDHARNSKKHLIAAARAILDEGQTRGASDV